jgi:peptidoglycan/LPS O-acetylase OafA/YrhL
MQSKLPWIESLRGFSAIWVVLFHLNSVSRFFPTSYQAAVDVGWLGVIVFFVVSGFSIQSAVQRPGSLSRYIWRRFFRIYPPYIASLVLVVTVIMWRKYFFGKNDLITLPAGLGGWLANVFVATWPVTTYRAVNWVYWSLGYEIAFYVILGFGVWVRRLTWPILIGVSCAACLLGAAPPHAVFFLKCWGFFALGVALAEWRARRGILPVLLAVVCGVDFVRNQSALTSCAAILTVLSCWLCSVPAFTWLNRERLFRWAGQWSYSLYLIHVPIGCWIGLRIASSIWGANVRQQGLVKHVLVDIGCLTISCVAAIVFWVLVERPSIAIMRAKPLWALAARHS